MKKQNIALWVLAGMLGVALLGVAIWAITISVNKTEEKVPILEKPTSDNGSYDYFEQLKETQENSDIDDSSTTVQELVSDTLASGLTTEQQAQVNIAYAVLLVHDNKPQEAIDACANIDIDLLNLEDLQSYYSVLRQSYTALGDKERAREYLGLEQEVVFKIEEDK